MNDLFLGHTRKGRPRVPEKATLAKLTDRRGRPKLDRAFLLPNGQFLGESPPAG